MREVTGQLRLQGSTPLQGVTVHLKLEQTDLADAPARVISEVILHDVDYDPAGASGIEFCIPVLSVDEPADYTLRAWVSLQGSRSVQKGDYITVESVPVLTRGRPSHVTVTLRQVE